MTHRSSTVGVTGVLLLLAVMGMAGCQGLRLRDAGRLEQGPWAQSGGSATRGNAASTSIPAALVPAWTYNAEAGFGPSSPVVAGEVVLVGTRKGDLHAIQMEDGRRIGYVSVGSSVEGAVAVAGQALYGAAATGKRPLFKYDLKQGRIAWRVASEPILSGVLLVDAAVVAAEATGRVGAYDAQTGALRWAYEPATPAAVRAAPVLTPAGVLIADDRGRLTLLDAATGAQRWTGQADGAVYSTPAVEGDRVFVSTTRGTLHALDARTGADLWRYQTADRTVRLTAPAVLDGQVAVASTDGQLRLLAADDGTVVWEASTDAAIVAPPILTRDVVFVGTMDKYLRAFDVRDGTLRASFELKGRMKSAMAVAGESLFVLSEPRFVYRFDAPTPPLP